MTNNSNEDFGHPNPDHDPLLDELLSQARWPEPDAAAVARLQSFVTTALADSGEAVTVVAPQTAASHRADYRRLKLVVAVCAAVLMAFLAGRWTSSDRAGGVATTWIDLPAPGSDQVSPKTIDPSSPLLSDKKAESTDDKLLVDVPSSESANSLRPSETLQPSPDPKTEKNRRLTQRERMQQQLDSVLACLEEGSKVDASCCQSLMPRRAEFEFLLGEVIRSATGQRQTAAVTAMGFIGTDSSVPVLLQSTASVDLRTTALEAVKRCSSEQMLAGLVLQRGDAAIRRELLTELAHRTTPQAAMLWLQLVRTAESRELCLQVADELSPALVEMLFAELDAPLIDDRMAAILTLGRRTDEQALQRVHRLCQQYPGRWEPVAILMWNGSEAALKVLTKMQTEVERYAVLKTASVQLQSFVGPAQRSPGP